MLKLVLLAVWLVVGLRVGLWRERRWLRYLNASYHDPTRKIKQLRVWGMWPFWWPVLWAIDYCWFNEEVS